MDAAVTIRSAIASLEAGLGRPEEDRIDLEEIDELLTQLRSLNLRRMFARFERDGKELGAAAGTESVVAEFLLAHRDLYASSGLVVGGTSACGRARLQVEFDALPAAAASA